VNIPTRVFYLLQTHPQSLKQMNSQQSITFKVQRLLHQLNAKP